MNTIRIAAALLSLATCPALAEGEGNNDRFALDASSRTAVGAPFLAETWSASLPASTGSTAQASALDRVQPALGSEAPVQTANSLPTGVWQGRPGVMQATGQATGQVTGQAAAHARRTPGAGPAH